MKTSLNPYCQKLLKTLYQAIKNYEALNLAYYNIGAETLMIKLTNFDASKVKSIVFCISRK